MNIPDYSQYTFEDFIMDADFRTWVLNPNAESREFWDQYIATHPEQDQTIREAVWVVQHLKMNEDVASPQGKQRIWQVLEKRLNMQPDTQRQISKPVPIKRLWQWQWAAVVALLIAVGGAGWYATQSHSQKINTDYGETRQVTLPDGSQVLLNGNSLLTYRDDWHENQAREVWLEGEAFFKVARQYDSRHQKVKFVTHTAQVDILVLGTQFNVNTRRGQTGVTLLEGKVQLINPQNASKATVVMQPGQYATLRHGVEKAEVRSKKPELHTAWVKRTFFFENTPLLEVASMLEDTYGLQITFEDREMTDYRLTANLSNQDSETLLKVMQATFNLEVHRMGNQVIFRRKK